MFCILKKWKYVQLIFQKLTPIVLKKIKKNLYNNPKQRKRHLALSCSKRLPALLRGTTSKKR